MDVRCTDEGLSIPERNRVHRFWVIVSHGLEDGMRVDIGRGRTG